MSMHELLAAALSYGSQGAQIIIAVYLLKLERRVYRLELRNGLEK